MSSETRAPRAERTGLLDRIRRNLARLGPAQRIPGVDLARGLAVVGMFAAHVAVVPDLLWSEPSTWGGLVDGRSSILFATLAGVSLALTSPSDPDDRAGVPPGTGFGFRLAIRALLVWLLGAALLLLDTPVYVILPAYGILFLIGIGLVRLSDAVLWCAAAGIAVLGPFAVAAIDGAGGPEGGSQWGQMLSTLAGWHYPFLLWTAFLAAGIAAGRLLRRAPERNAPGLLCIGAVLAVIGYGAIGPIGNGAEEGSWLAALQDAPHSSGMGEAIGSGGFALAVIGLCVLLAAPRPLRWLSWPLRAVGAMPLTAYTAHLVVWQLWISAELRETGFASPLDGFRAAEPFWPLTIGIAIGCMAWTLLIGRGPLEAAIARLSALVTGPGPGVRRSEG